MGWEDDAVLLRDFGGDVCMPAYISIVVLTKLQGLAMLWQSEDIIWPHVWRVAKSLLLEESVVSRD